MTTETDRLIQTALAHHGAGRLAEAASLYEQILGAAPDRADILHLCGICAFQEGRAAHAETCIRRAIALAPAEPDYHNSLSVVLAESRAFANAVAAAEQAVQRAPDNPVYRLTLANALYGTGRIDAARDAYSCVAAARPGSAEALSALGGIAFDRGDDQTAAACLAGAADASPDYGWARAIAVGEAYRQRTGAGTAARALAGFPALSGDLPPAGDRPLVFAACDAAYLDAHAIALARSVDRHAPGHDVHLHVMAAPGLCDASLARLARSLSRSRLTVSRETPPPGADRVYFSNMRFVRLWQSGIVGHRTVLALDADSLVRGPIDAPKAADGAAAAAATLLRSWLPHLNRRILATSILLRPDARAQDLLADVAAQILAALADGSAAWYLDQCAFALAAGMAARRPGAAVLGDLDRRYGDDTMSDRAIVWSAKGDSKQNRRYREEADRLAA